MKLESLRVLCLDAQTTGMRPPKAQLLELAWAFASPAGRENPLTSYLLTASEPLAPRIQEITGLSDETLQAQGLKKAQVAEALRHDLLRADVLAIHYAQFEKPFLLDLLGELPLPPILCTQQMIKRALPALPRQNLRASAGFFGPAVLGPNRAGVFVRATEQIWRGLQPELLRLGLATLSDLQAWLSTKASVQPKRYEYRLDKFKRLELPQTPGVYRMLGKNGEILYVGKATSLRDRVNSYFRGKKGRDSRKLEMLAQVWDLRVTPVATPLEAALLESDEIKRHNPPYNMLLKTGRRHLVFYNRDFTAQARRQDPTFFYGPFRPQNWIEPLRLIAQSLKNEDFEQIFFNPLPPADLRAGFELFCLRQNLPLERLHSVRSMLAHGLHLHRKYVEPVVETVAEETPEIEDSEVQALSVEDIADKFERLFRRSGRDVARMRKLTRLLNAQVDLDGRTLRFQNGQVLGEQDEETQKGLTAPNVSASKWSGLDIETFDRMSILLSELQRRKTQSKADLTPQNL